jgi:Putative Zn-dependent protease, contains TPR repeats
MYNKAFREFSAANYDQALTELDAIDARQPDLAESQNLRGVILMRQAQYDQAEAALQKALATDPKFWNARFNLAEIHSSGKTGRKRGSVSKVCFRGMPPNSRATRPN